MATVEHEIQRLRAGDNLARDEFLRRWEAMPHIKRAELIGGIVFMPSPLSPDHAEMEVRVCHWLSHYSMYTPGCIASSNATWLMLEDSPQPDIHLRIAPGVGEKGNGEGRYLEGAPEFIAEICVTSAAYDLHQKLELYRAAGVKEYLTVLVSDREVRWHRLVRRNYKLMAASGEGIYRSMVFPGLWLDTPAVLEGNMLKVIETLELGLHTPEHDAFVKELASRRS